jgi:hypothetical protein
MATIEKLQELFNSFELSKKMKASDYDNLITVLKDYYDSEMLSKCKAIIKSGEKKGTRCSSSAQKDSHFCKRHEKIEKNDDKKNADDNECNAKVDGNPCSIMVPGNKPRPDSAKNYYCYRHFSSWNKFE